MCTTTPPALDQEARISHNRRRGARFSSLKREANALARAIDQYLQHGPGRFLDEEAKEHLKSFRRKLGACCQMSLYRQFFEGQGLEYIGSATCKHKACPVCNAERARRLRAKWYAYLQAHAELLTDYDPVHITLTVPHNAAGGFRGERFYAVTLIRLFRELRDNPEWKRLVFAGEYNVEVTRHENGLHFHIHALAFLHKRRQNRNQVHRYLLTQWNALTVDPAATRRAFTEQDLASIKKGNATLTELDLAQLRPQGATLVGVESLYTLHKGRQSKLDRWVPEKQRWKHYIDPATDPLSDVLGGIMECLKYHFEPFALKGEDGYDLDLLAELLPKIFHKPMYQKFGAFRGVKELNITYEAATPAEEQAALLSEYGHDEVINPATLKPAEREEYTYVITSAASVYWIRDENNRPVMRRSAPRSDLGDAAFRLSDALKLLIELSIRPRDKPLATAARV